MKKKTLYSSVIDYFEREMPVVDTELNYGSTFQLLVAVVLSAQCTDKRVNMVTPRLFADYPTADVMAVATPEVLYEYIKSVSYPNNKAKHLVGLSRAIMDKHGGDVPDTLEELIALPGVGRKTANVMLAVVWGKSAMAVDTHIYRVSHRLGLVSSACTTPYAVEKELVRHFPADIVPRAHHWLLLHGRYVCQSRSPKCGVCGLRDICKYKLRFED
jgi:endonuclease-3